MKIQIKVNKQTSPIIQQLLFDRGYKWGTGLNQDKKWPDERELSVFTEERQVWVSVYPDNVIDKRLNASTQLGELLELLDKKEITVKDVAIENGLRGHPIFEHQVSRDAIISADKTYLTIGCSRVSKEKVKEVYEKMFD